MARQHAAHSIIEMFVVLRGRATRKQLKRINGSVLWPSNWTDRHYNGGRRAMRHARRAMLLRGVAHGGRRLGAGHAIRSTTPRSSTAVRKLCPNCEELLKPTSNPEVGQCSGCGWSGHYWRAARNRRCRPHAENVLRLASTSRPRGWTPRRARRSKSGPFRQLDDAARQIAQVPLLTWSTSNIVGQPFALALNADILRKLANPQKTEDFLPPRRSGRRDGRLAQGLRLGRSKAVTPAGKNFASFDRQFLKRLPDFENKVRLHHRTLDPATLFWLLCGRPHNSHSVAQPVMWRPARFLGDFRIRRSAGRHIIRVLQGSQKLHESRILAPSLLRLAILDFALHKCFGLHLQIDLRIHVGRVEAIHDPTRLEWC